MLAVNEGKNIRRGQEIAEDRIPKQLNIFKKQFFFCRIKILMYFCIPFRGMYN